MYFPALLYEIGLMILSGFGILNHSGILKGKYRKDMFVYYTNLSNLAVFLFFSFRLIIKIFFKNIGQAHLLYKLFFSGTALMAITLCILTTFIIYHFILVPIIKRQRESFGEFGNIFSLGNLIVHYFVPLLTLLYWLLFAPKQGLNVYSVICFVVIPLIYAAYIFLRAIGKVNIEGTNSPYPYEFMDPSVIGIKRTVINMIMLFFAFCLMGALFVGISKFF